MKLNDIKVIIAKLEKKINDDIDISNIQIDDEDEECITVCITEFATVEDGGDTIDYDCNTNIYRINKDILD